MTDRSFTRHADYRHARLCFEVGHGDDETVHLEIWDTETDGKPTILEVDLDRNTARALGYRLVALADG